jgi:pimeloyl-ACP methyl ester carboxylesterase
MSITTIDGHLVHYEAFGRGTPMVFIHGWLGSWRYWWNSMQSLSNYHRNFALDLWGFGDSSKEPKMYSLEAYVEMVDLFVENLGITTPLNFAGHALGAVVATQFARKRPEVVHRMILTSTPLRGQDIHSQLSKLDTDTFIKRQLGRGSHYPEVIMGAEKTDNRAVHLLAKQLSNDDFTNNLRDMPVPTLVVHGENDSVIDFPKGVDTATTILDQSSQVVLLPGCDHFPMLDKPAVFTRLIQDFIQGGSESDISPKQYWQRRTR